LFDEHAVEAPWRPPVRKPDIWSRKSSTFLDPTKH
jgi:hypothetical protein